MEWVRRPGNFHVSGDGSDELAGFAGSSFAYSVPQSPAGDRVAEAGANSAAPTVQPTADGEPAGIHDVVFIDSRVPDIQDLLNGLKPGEKAFIIDAGSDGLDQISTILKTEQLDHLTGVQIVAHGAAGELELGSAVIGDSSLSSHAGALAQIGAALSPGADLSLYACDTAAGARGQQFIADLSKFVGGAEVVASTHDIGQTASGENWTLDASSGSTVPTASVAFTATAQANFQGTLSVPNAQVWFVTAGGGLANSIDHVDNVAGSNTASNAVTLYSSATSLFNHPTDITLDTVDGLYFFIDSDGSGHNLIREGSLNQAVNSPNAAPTLTTIYTESNTPGGPPFFGDLQALQVDVTHHVIYFAQNDSNATTVSFGEITFSGPGFSGTPTETTLATISTPTIFIPDMALDLAHGTAYFIGTSVYVGFGGTTVGENLIYKASGVGTNTVTVSQLPITPHDSTLGVNNFPTSDGVLQSIDVDTTNEILYFTADATTPTSNGGIYSYALNGNPSGNFTTVWQQPSPNSQTSTAGTPFTGVNYISVDAAANTYYVDDLGTNSHLNLPDNSIYVGHLTGTTAQMTPSLFLSLNTSGPQPGPEGLVVDNAPTLSLTNSGPTFTESVNNPASSNNTPVATISGATANDTDSFGELAGATVSISSGFFAGDALSVTLTGNITIASNTGGVLTLTGADTFADYQTVLNSIHFTSTSDNPTDYGADNSRTITYTVSDGLLSSAPVTSTVTVVGVNDPPTLNNAGNSISYVEQAAAKAVDSAITVTDPDNLGQAHATVTISSGLQAGDTLHFTNNPATMGNIAFTSYTGGVLTLTSAGGSATQAQWDAALQSVTFDNATNNDPTVGGDNSRTITWVINDGAADSSSVTTTINVTPVNDAPTLSATATNPTFTEAAGVGTQAAAVGVFSGATADTIESGQTITSLTFTVSGLVDGANEQVVVDGTEFALSNGGNGTTSTNSLSYTVSVVGGTATVVLSSVAGISAANAAAVVDSIAYQDTSTDNPTPGDRTFTITAIKDSGGTSNGGVDTTSPGIASTVHVVAVNDPPVNTVPGAQTVNEDTSLAFTGAKLISVSDPDNASLTVALSAAHGNITLGTTAGLSVTGVNGSHVVTIAGLVTAIDTALASLSYQGDPNFNGPDALTVDTSDGIAPHTVSTVGLTVTPVNDAPVVVNGTTATLVSINEDAANPAGAQVSTLVGGHFSDTADDQTANGGTGPNSLAGIAVIANVATASQGTWQYFSAGTWHDIATSIPVASALLVDSTSLIRFLPAADFNGTPGDLIAYLVDTSAGAITSGTTADLTTTGGSTPYSTGTVSIGETVNPVNDAPVFSGLDNTPSFTEGGLAVVLDGNATVTDVELAALNGGNGNYAGATLTLERHNGASAQDVFGTSGSLAFNGTNVQISGNTVGTLTNSGGVLAITFNINATSALVDSVLDQLTYSNSSDAPSSPVQIDYTFSDGNTGTQGPGGPLTASGHVSVSITPTNDAPVLTPASPSAVTYVEGQTSPVALLSTGAVTDPDNPANFNNGSLTVAIGSAHAGDEIVLLGSSPITNSAGTLMDGATSIGTVTGLGTNSVSVSLNAGATTAEVDKLVESFGFETSSASTADRSVTFTFEDGGNVGGTPPGLSSAVTQTVHEAPTADGQLFFRIDQGNDVQLGDINNTGSSASPHSIYFGGGNTSGTPQNIGVFNGNETSVAVDTAAGLVFSVGIGNAGSYDAVSVHNLNTGALIETIEFGPNTGSVNTDDVVQALALDSSTNTLYVGDWGTTLATTGVAEFSYSPTTGLLTPNSAGNSGTSITTTIAGGSSTTTTANGIYLFTATDVPQYTNANAFYLDSANHKLYYVNDDSGYNFSPYSPTNAVYVVNTNGPTFTATQLTSLTQFPTADQSLTGHDQFIGPNGSVLGLAVDVADGVVFFETTDNVGSANNALWWVNTTGANQTATKIALPAGVTLNFAGQTNEGGDAAGLTFDALTKQLYLTNAQNDTTVPDKGAIYQLQYDPGTHTVTLLNTYDTAQLVGATPSTVNSFDAPSTTTFDNLPVLSGVTGTATHATEQGAAVSLLSGAPTITDADGDHLASATVQIAGGTFSSNENSTADDHLGFAAANVTGNQINGTSITFSYDSATETLTLGGYDTLTHYQTALSEVQYFTTGDNPTNYGLDPVRTVDWQVNDGALGNPVSANTATTFISVDAVNDPPVNTAPSSTLTVNEDTSLPINGGNTISVADPDNQTLTVTLTAANGTVTLGSVTNLSVTGTNGSGSVAVSGTIADINAALATLSYQGNANYFGADTITVDSFDGTAHTQSTVNITVNPVNDAPVLDLDANNSSGAVNADYQATYSVGGASVAIADVDTTITDVDNVTLASATITLTNHQANDLLSVTGTLPANIVASSYDAVTGVLTLTGTGATLADFQTALHEITFSNLSATPGFADRIITVVVDDGMAANHASNLATSTIHVANPTDAPPVIANLSGDSSTFTEGGAAVHIDVGTAATVTDADSPNFDTGSLTVHISANGVAAEDVIGIDTAAATTVTLSAGLSAGSHVSVGGTDIGTIAVNGDGTGGHDLVVTLDANATPANVGTLIDAVTYLNSNPDNPSGLVRTVAVTVNDGAGASGSVNVTVNVTAVNDAPVATTPVAHFTAAEQTDLSLKGTGLSVSDVDANGGSEAITLSVGEGTLTLGTGTSGAIIDSGNGTNSVTFHGTIAQLNALLNTDGTSTVVYNDNTDTPSANTTLTLAVNDGGNTGTGGPLVGTNTATIDITAVNDAPAALMTTNPYAATENVALNLKGTGMSVSDADALGASETVTLSATEGTLTLVAGTSGVVIDSGNGTGSVTFHGTIAQINALLNTDGTSTVSYIDNNDNPAANATLSLSINDGGHTGTGGPLVATATSTVDITAVNDAPVALIATNPYSVAPNTALDLKGSGLSVSDVDGNNGIETVVLSVAEGTLTLAAGTSGAIIDSGNGTGSVTFHGTIAQLDALLNTDGTSAVSYIDSSANPAASVQLSLSVNDAGHTGTGGSLTDTALAVINVIFPGGAPGAFDFNFDNNGNGHADTLLQSSTSGGVSIWESGQLSGASPVTTSMPNNWHIAGVGDFDGNGKSDILWQNDSGLVAIWDNSQGANGHYIATSMPSNWHVAGTGDFDGNGKTDILWQNGNGTFAIWDDGQGGKGHYIATSVPNTWHVAGVGDFDGNGKSDILWQNDNGTFAIWNDGQGGKGHYISFSMPNTWHVAGVGDFDGNGKSDILWQSDNGSFAIWNDGQGGNGHYIANSVASSWHVAGVGDFNGDHKSDILWHNDNGAIVIWDSAEVGHTVAGPGVVPNDWHIIV